MSGKISRSLGTRDPVPTGTIHPGRSRTYYTDIAELEWFFSSAESQMGVQSNFGAIRNALLNGGVSRTSVPDSMSDSRVLAAERYRGTHARIKRMPKFYQDILYACYQPRQWSPKLWDAFGRRLGATPYSATANHEFDRDCKLRYVSDSTFFAWLEGACLRSESWRIDKIRKEADELLENAYQEFAATRLDD